MAKRSEITADFIDRICELYNDCYDDAEEDSSIGGSDWKPGKLANHKSLASFKAELEESGIYLSTGKIRKILITGGRYSTTLSRSIDEELENYAYITSDKERIAKVAEKLSLSPKTVSMYMPYTRQVYNESPSQNAQSVKKWRLKRDEELQNRLEEQEKAQERAKRAKLDAKMQDLLPVIRRIQAVLTEDDKKALAGLSAEEKTALVEKISEKIDKADKSDKADTSPQMN